MYIKFNYPAFNIPQLERTMNSIEQHINHYLEGRCHFARSQSAATCFAWGKRQPWQLCHGLTSSTCHTDRVSGIDSTYLSLRHFYRGDGGWDNGSSSCTRDVPIDLLGYDVYPANGRRAQRHSYLHQFRHRDSATANVTHHHSYLHQTPSRDMVAAILHAAQQ